MKLEELGFKCYWKDERKIEYDKDIRFFGNVAIMNVMLYRNANENKIRVELMVNGEEVKADVNRELLEAIMEEIEALGW